MFKRTALSASLLAAFGCAYLPAPAFAQNSDAATLQRVEVTGTSIRRANAEGPVPVEIYTRKQIERNGATTVNELLKSIATIDINDSGELASNSPAGSGTANIRMRGLDEASVLILLNGRRLPINGIYDSSGAGAAVDVNTIPLSAIERVEILKEGASAIYGADAVAGVINFITRKNYSGMEAKVGFGGASQGGGAERRGGLTFGHGDLEENGFNILASVDLFKRNPIYRKDRDISRSANFSRFGGPDGRSSFTPYGNLLDSEFNFTGSSIVPCPADLYAGGRCRYDFNSDLLTAYNGADRLSGMLIGSLKLPNDIRLTGEFLVAKTKDYFEAHPVPDYFIASSGDYYAGRFMQGGPRITNRKSDLSQLSLGLEGRFGTVDWTIDAGQGSSKVTNRDRNYFNADLWNAATSSGALDATISTNDQSLVDSLKVSPVRVGKSVISFANAKLSGEFGSLPGGAVGYAVGASVWREKLTDVPDALTQAGLVIGSIQQAPVDASRKMYALFGELSLPVTKSLEGQLALRYDHYPTATKTSPKIGAKYIVSPNISVRGSYSQSFRAPSLKQMFGAREEGAADFTSDELCAAYSRDPGCTITGFQVNGSNPDLKPEKGKTLNIGVVVEPIAGLSASVDWWRINIKDSIDTPTIDQAVAAGSYGRDSTGRVVVETALKNFAEVKNEGVDLDVRWLAIKTGFGQISLRNAVTYYIHQRRITDPVVGWEEFNGTYNKPRWRNVFTLGLDSGSWQGNLGIRTVGGFYDTDEPNPDVATERKVGSHTEIDVSGAYTGLKGFRFDLGVKNLMDRMPPFSYQNAVSNQYSQMGFAELYTSRGRFVYATVTYTFF